MYMYNEHIDISLFTQIVVKLVLKLPYCVLETTLCKPHINSLLSLRLRQAYSYSHSPLLHPMGLADVRVPAFAQPLPQCMSPHTSLIKQFSVSFWGEGVSSFTVPGYLRGLQGNRPYRALTDLTHPRYRAVEPRTPQVAAYAATRREHA